MPVCILRPMAQKIHSQDVTEGDAKAAARAMLRAVGLTDDDFSKPQIGLVSAGNEVTPCNVTGPMLAEAAKEGVRAADGVGLVFATIAVSDGISMGHEGMRASLVSREVIADSVELVMHGETVRRDGEHRRVRQVAAGHVDGGGAHQPPIGVPLRRIQLARQLSGPGHLDRRCLRGDRGPL